MIQPFRGADICNEHLQSLQRTARNSGAELKAYENQGLLARESEVSLSEAAQHIARGKKVTLKEEVSSTVSANVSLLCGWKTYQTEIKVVQQLATPIGSAEELAEFRQFRDGQRDTPTQQVAGQFHRHEFGLGYEEFNLILPVKNSILGGRKVEAKFAEPAMDVKVISSLSAFASARYLAKGRPVAVSRVETNAVLNHQDDFKDKLQSQFVASPSDLMLIR